VKDDKSPILNSTRHPDHARFSSCISLSYMYVVIIFVLKRPRYLLQVFFIKKRFGNIVISQDLHRKRIVAEDLSNRQDHIFQTRSKKLIRDETLPLFKNKIYLWYSRYKIRANQTPFNYIFLDLGRFVEN
jgi:hypothetical protein